MLVATTIPYGLLVLSGPLWARRPPYYCSWFLGSQAGALPVVHIARFGGDLSILLSATVPVMLLAEVPPTLASTTGIVVLVLASAVASITSYRRAHLCRALANLTNNLLAGLLHIRMQFTHRLLMVEFRHKLTFACS